MAKLKQTTEIYLYYIYIYIYACMYVCTYVNVHVYEYTASTSILWIYL